MFNILKNLNFKNKLLLAFFAVSIVPFCVLALSSLKNMTLVLERGVYQELEIVREIKKSQIERYYSYLVRVMQHVQSDSHIYNVLLEFGSASVKNGDHVSYEESRQRVVGGIEVVEILAGEHGFYNVFLIDDAANIVFTLEESPELGDNLLAGTMKTSQLSKAFAAARNGEIQFVDFEWHEHAKELMAFLCTPIYNSNGQFAGMAAFQISLEEIDFIMSQRQGMGETGESYLVGPDYLMRSDSFLDPVHHSVAASFAEPDKGSVKTEAVRKALRGEVGHRIVEDYLGKRVVSCYTPVHLGNVTWALLAEKNENEAFAPLFELRQQVFLMSFVSILVILATVFFAANGLSKRVSWLQNIAMDIARRKLQDEVEEDEYKDELSQVTASLCEVNDSFLQVTKVAETAAAGDFSERVQELGKDDSLAIALNRMIDSFAEIVRQTNAVAQGDYNVEVPIRSDKDQLGRALRHMTAELAKAQSKEDRQRWLQVGVTNLDDKLRGEQDVEELAGNVVSNLCNYLGCQVGAVYVQSQSNKEGYTFAGGYAFSKPSDVKLSFKLGEGLVGQAALEKQPIWVNDLLSDYIKVTSGLGDAVSNNILVFPFVHDDKVIGVAELGSVSPFNNDHLEFVGLVERGIAIAFEAAFSRLRLGEALSESQSLTEELQVQHEELEESNKMLEEQTSALEQAQQDAEEHNRQLEMVHAELQERAEQLAMASKYKTEFLANMSHELRTPLNSILLLSKVLAEDDSETITDDQKKQASVIHDAGTELLQLINEVLDMSKIEAGHMSIVKRNLSLGELVTQVKALFEPQLETKGLYFEIQIDKDLPESFQTDPSRVQQIVRNFLSNAVKFTREGGVTLQVSYPTSEIINDIVSEGTLLVEEMAREPEKFIAISVADTGTGIDKTQHGKIFQAFQQVDGSSSREFGGTGLGLSISLQLAKLLGGAIALRSEIGQGATFSVLLPLHMREVSEPKSLVLDQNRTHKRADRLAESKNSALADDRIELNTEDKRVLLVIEDDLRFAEILIALGRGRGFKVVHAVSGTEGLRYAEHYLPTAIILDIQLPVMDGWNVLRHLKKNGRTRHIPVNIVSIVRDENFGHRLGAVQYITKPVDKDKLNSLFESIESEMERSVRKLLVVDDNATQQEAIKSLLGDDDVEITTVGTGADALREIRTCRYSSMILDLQLPDMDGYDILKEIREGDNLNCRIPTVVYTGRALSLEDERKLREYADSIVLKTAESPARLLEETSIFLHRVQAGMSRERRELLEEIANVDKTFVGKTVLLVDDDIRNTYALSASLKKKGLSIITAANGQEGLEMLAAHDSIDIVLMDIMMPVMDGFEAIRRIRELEQFSDLPVIAITAKALVEDREKCIEVGASDYMSKPIDHDQLFSLIRVWLSVKTRNQSLK